MTPFKKFINRFNIPLYVLAQSKAYPHYLQWLHDPHVQPSPYLLQQFISTFKPYFNNDVLAFLACFTFMPVQDDYKMIALSSGRYAYRNTTIILHLLLTHFRQCRVLVLNATLHPSLENALSLSSTSKKPFVSLTLDGASSFSIIETPLQDFIYQTCYKHVDYLNISVNQGLHVSPEEENFLCTILRKKLIDLNTYDYFIMNIGLISPGISRILGQLSHLTISFNDVTNTMSQERFFYKHGLDPIRDEYFILDIPSLTVNKISLEKSIALRFPNEKDQSNFLPSSIYLSEVIAERLSD